MASTGRQFRLFIETDFSGLTNNRTATVSRAVVIGDQFTFSNRIDYFGTVRGRIGLAVDRTLVYFTAGLTHGHPHNTFGNLIVDGTFAGTELFGFSSGQTRVGYTVAGGVEFAITPNWSVPQLRPL